MASFVYVCDIKDKNSSLGLKKTRYKTLATWIAATGAIETPMHPHPGLTTFCHTLPDGRQVKAEVLDEEVVGKNCEAERALNSVNDFYLDEKTPRSWRVKALGDALKAEKTKRERS